MPRPDASDKLAAAAPSSRLPRALIAGLVILVVLAGVGLAVLLGTRGAREAGPTPAASTSSAAAPAASGQPSSAAPASGAAPKGALGFGQPMRLVEQTLPQGTPVVVVYEDPQCPICRQFERIFGAALADLAAKGEADVRAHTMTFLDDMLKNDSSKRAANGSFCAADQGRFKEYSTAMFAGQPEREGTGWTDAQLKGFATTAGVGDIGAWESCQKAMPYTAHIDALEVNAEKGGITGTPTMTLNGEKVSLGGLTAEALVEKIKAAKK